MLRNEDLAAAVKAGVITPEQQAALERQAASRHAARPFIAGRDERFRFLRGFNDVFLSLGVVLVTVAFLSQWSPSRNEGIGYLITGALALWAISEVLVARHKAVLPGMAAVLGIGMLITFAAGHWAWVTLITTATDGGHWRGDISGWPARIWFFAVGAGGLAVLAYYLRFRLPFALLPLGLGAMTTIILGCVYQFGFDTTRVLVNAIAMFLGLAVFALAMRYDSTDPERLTRRADCGFWLHLAAAPFIVHPAIALLGSGNSMAGALLTILIVGLLGIVALIIDRRALLVSSLTYFGFAIGYLLTPQSGVTQGGGAFAVTLGLLGAFVILMGLGWHPLRRAVLRPFNGAAWLKSLPPVQTT